MLSIIVPIYNVEKYLCKCIDSVIAQTYQEWELLLIDDGSTDNSGNICDEYAKKDSRIRTFHNKNRGASAARNTGLDASIGEWIYFLDGDDYISDDCIELMIQCVKKHPKTDAVYAGTEVINGFHTWASYKGKNLPEYTEDAWWINTAILKRDVLGMGPCNKLLRKKKLTDAHMHFVDGLRYEDEVWNMQLAQVIHSLCILKKDTYFYIKHCDSSMGQNNKNHQKFYLRLKMWNSMIDHIQGERWQIQNQVKQIASWAVGISLTYYPYIKRLSMPKLLLRLAIKARSKLSFPLLYLSLLALIKSPAYKEFSKHHYIGL